MIPNFENIAILVIDVQEKLVAAMKPSIVEDVVKNIDILVELVSEHEGDVIYSEQYPHGLGSTVEPLKARLAGSKRIEKITFSCLDDTDFVEDVLASLPDDVIVVGMEAHVCVLSTVIDLFGDAISEEEGRTIYVPIDAVCSRKKLHWQNALDQMAELGIVLTNTETLVFQALGEAGTDRFKHFSKRIR